MGLFSFLTKKNTSDDAAANKSAGKIEDSGLAADSQAGDSTLDVTAAEADKLDAKLAKTRKRFTSGLLDFLTGKKIDDNLLDDLEAQLVMSDVSVTTATKIIESVRDAAKSNESNDLQSILRKQLTDLLQPCQQPLEIPDNDTPFVLLVVGRQRCRLCLCNL